MFVDVDLRHRETSCGAIEPIGILLYMKQIEIAVRARVGLRAIENHLSAMETLRCGIERQRPIRPDDRIVPAFSRRVVLREHACGEMPPETQRVRQHGGRRLRYPFDANVELAHKTFSPRKFRTSPLPSSSNSTSP